MKAVLVLLQLLTLLIYPNLVSGWEECTDAAIFALLRDKLNSGYTEQAFELKDTQRLKKHLQQVVWGILHCSMPNFITSVTCCGCFVAHSKM
jgi:hypothetical protein